MSASLQQGSRPTDTDLVQRLSAPEIERFVATAIGRWAPKVKDPFAIVRSVCLSDRGLQVAIDAAHAIGIGTRLADDETILDRSTGAVTALLPIRFASRGNKYLIFPAGSRPPQQDDVLIAALRKAHSMLRIDRGMPVMESAPGSPYYRNILRLAFLAPDIQRAILDGRQPLELNLEKLKKITIPLVWSQQRKVLGFGFDASPYSGDQIP